MGMINTINKRNKYQLFWKSKTTNTALKYFGTTTCPIDIELSFFKKDFKPFKIKNSLSEEESRKEGGVNNSFATLFPFLFPS